MAGKKCTKAEYKERLAAAVHCLRLCMPKWQIKDFLQEQYGISRRHGERYVARARQKMQEEDETPRMDKRSKVSALLEYFMSDENVSVQQRVRAAREYIRLHGLREVAPMEDEQTQDIEIVIPDWRSEYVNRLASGDVASAKNGNGVSGNGSSVKSKGDEVGNNGGA